MIESDKQPEKSLCYYDLRFLINELFHKLAYPTGPELAVWQSKIDVAIEELSTLLDKACDIWFTMQWGVLPIDELKKVQGKTYNDLRENFRDIINELPAPLAELLNNDLFDSLESLTVLKPDLPISQLLGLSSSIHVNAIQGLLHWLLAIQYRLKQKGGV